MRIQVESLIKMKQLKLPIVVMTCYDCPTAKLQDAAGIDVVFVGDSVGQNVLGYVGPQQVTMSDMLHHTRAVNRGVQDALLMVDLPYGSYQTPEMAVENGLLLVDAGAEVVKLEGGREVRDQVIALVGAGIGVVGHIGYTPQTRIGERPLYGDRADEAVLVLEDALALETAGALGVVLECIPERVAEVVTTHLSIPTIGIGAGRVCDGQVLVVNDLLGFYEAPFRFVRQYANIRDIMKGAFVAYAADVRSGQFPAEEHRFLMKNKELRAFREQIESLAQGSND
ncbi:MAG: 3-methyl-2-oxobutanoate hydroxymethyltransferase [Candidatus Latescibacteria bacterium]|nr:3-methyl-2-oxobutanoate hydroxymethyltransferase [Candidatus Latescibacterota bacterium]MBT4139504.1 3-methyl-2-oxobutanoate hydroxymethyltransferase [Candidatus Latescibacterota bacterium]MBT5830485.1 3-methyl-2-oxobutanoate hydroxymethyltransferase [Candidatus Latescibacterota bacterium]